MAGKLRFADQVAIVTGGCSGIGKACAEVFVEEGGRVAVLDINDELGNAINASDGERIWFVHCDIAKDTDVMKAVDATIEKFGQLDCLVNNAAIGSPTKIDDEDFMDEFKHVFEVNIFGYARVSKYCLPHLRKTKGSIVNIASAGAWIGFKDSLPYVSSKGAVASLTKALALDEAKHGVRVNLVAPGPVRTPLLENFFETRSPSERQQILDGTILRRLAEPVEIAKTCLYLAVDATYSTGADIFVSGGQELGLSVKM